MSTKIETITGELFKKDRKEYTKQYYAKNRDKINAQFRERYNTNKDEFKAKYEANKELYLTRNKKSREKYKEERSLKEKEYHRINKERISLRNKEKYKNNTEQFKQQAKDYRERHRYKLLLKDKEYYSNNKERISQRNKKKYLLHKEVICQKTRDYNKNNRPKIREYIKKHYKTNIQFKLGSKLRGRIVRALKYQNAKKIYLTEELTGCTVQELKTYLESLWQSGMSWDNYSYEGWHIDHIKPCCTFDLTDPEQQKQCFHYTNLRPLWAKDNFSRPKDGSDVI